MSNACLYFQVHQPFRMRRYTVFDIGANGRYFDDTKNREIMQRVTQKCYLPANRALREVIARHDDFKVAFSITGTALEQFAEYAPAVLDSFEELASTGAVEFLSETSHHSLASLFDEGEFVRQVRMHQKLIKDRFRQRPTVFRNTELMYDNRTAKLAQDLGFRGVLAEGAERMLGDRSPNLVYAPANAKHVRVLLKNYRLSDDIAFRFGDKSWGGYPLTAKKYASWVAASQGDCVNLFLDYETFGEHKWEDTGIFSFLKQLPQEFGRKGIRFRWPSELARRDPAGTLDAPEPVSWADTDRDSSAWLGNRIQRLAAERLYALRKDVFATGDKALIESWRRLSTSDHVYYMCTKKFADGDVHKYFNPYESPYEAFITYMNVLNDLAFRANNRGNGTVGAALRRLLPV